jgi:transposase
MIHSKDIREKLKDLDEFLMDDYKKAHPEKKRDWRTYEQQYALRLKTAMRQLEPLVDEACNIHIVPCAGRRHGLSLKQRVMLILLQRIFGESNRMMASMLAVFSVMGGVDVSYKSIERLYDDEDVGMALHNLHVIILRRKGIKNAEAAGDGTGYSLTITKHYATEAQKLKDKAKENTSEEPKTGTDEKPPPVEGKARVRKPAVSKKKAFAFSFKLMDVGSQMYLSYGTSLKSEREAFDRSMVFLKTVDVELDSVRLDRYYSASVYVDMFPSAKVYVIPKKNATLNGSWKWKRGMFHFVDHTMEHLEEYYKRCLTESGWSADKRQMGWGYPQKLPDRIDRADECTMLWHNLFRLGPS